MDGYRIPLFWIILLVCPANTLAADASVDKRESFGAVAGPAVLPSGATAVYGFIGVPELAAGYRQGLGDFEWEARARFHYLDLAVAGEILLKYRVYQGPRGDLAPYLGVGLVGDTGSQYFDAANFPYLGLRVMGGLIGTYRFADTVRGIAQLEVPYDFALGPAGGARFTPLGGGGLEIYLGQDVSGLALGELGVDVVKQPLGIPIARLGYSFRLGVGFRLF